MIAKNNFYQPKILKIFDSDKKIKFASFSKYFIRIFK